MWNFLMEATVSKGKMAIAIQLEYSRYWYNETNDIIRWCRMSKEEAEAGIKYHMKDFKVVVTYHGD